jgi:hypothetical protein
VLGGRLVADLAVLLYMTDSGDRTMLVPVYQAGEAHSTFRRMTVRMRCCAR